MGEVLAPLSAVAMIVAVIFLIVSIRKKMRKKRSSCPGCHAQYQYPEDFEVILCSDLKWRTETKTEKSGEVEYKVQYKVFYRLVAFKFKCSKCGHEHQLTKQYDVYNSDCGYSQTDAEEIDLLKHKIRKTFDSEVFGDREIELHFIQT